MLLAGRHCCERPVGWVGLAVVDLSSSAPQQTMVWSVCIAQVCHGPRNSAVGLDTISYLDRVEFVSDLGFVAACDVDGLGAWV